MDSRGDSLSTELLDRIQRLNSFLLLPVFRNWAKPGFTNTLSDILSRYDFPTPPASELNSCGYWGPLDWVTGRYLVNREIKAISKAIDWSPAKPASAPTLPVSDSAPSSAAEPTPPSLSDSAPSSAVETTPPSLTDAEKPEKPLLISDLIPPNSFSDHRERPRSPSTPSSHSLQSPVYDSPAAPRQIAVSPTEIEARPGRPLLAREV